MEGYTLHEIAKLTGLSYWTTYWYASRNDLKGTKFGGTSVLSPDDAIKLRGIIDNRRKPGRPRKKQETAQ